MIDKNELKIVFMGTPEFAVATLEALVNQSYNVVAVVTQPDKPVGRHGSVLQAPAVKVFAQSKGIPVLQPEKMKDPNFVETLRGYNAHLFVVVAFRMLPEVVWSMPQWGTFNVHAALLPKYRGAAPINWAIIRGEKITGVTTFFLDHDIDTGRIIAQKTFDIPDNVDVEYVYNGLMHLGAELALETIEDICEAHGQVRTMPQAELTGTENVFDAHGNLLPQYHAPKLFKETCQINWEQSARHIHNFVRGLSPVPAAWSMLNDKVVKIYQTLPTNQPSKSSPGTLHVEKSALYVDTADFQLEILSLQLAGKKRMPASAFVNGLQDKDDTRRFS